MGVCSDWKNLRLYRRKSGSLPLSVSQSAQRLLYGKADGDYEAEGQEIRKERGLERDSRQTDYIRHFISCGAMGMVKRWLAEGMPLSKAEMMDLTEKIMHPIFQLLFVA